MKNKGIIRNVDKQGRVVIPNEMRKQINIEGENDAVEILLEGDSIVIRKHRPACFFCDKLDEMVEYNGYRVCVECAKKLKELADEIE